MTKYVCVRCSRVSPDVFVSTLNHYFDKGYKISKDATSLLPVYNDVRFLILELEEKKDNSHDS